MSEPAFFAYCTKCSERILQRVISPAHNGDTHVLTCPNGHEKTITRPRELNGDEINQNRLEGIRDMCRGYLDALQGDEDQRYLKDIEQYMFEECMMLFFGDDVTMYSRSSQITTRRNIEKKQRPGWGAVGKRFFNAIWDRALDLPGLYLTKVRLSRYFYEKNSAMAVFCVYMVS